MANEPKSDVNYRIDTAAEISLYGFAGFMDVLTAIPVVNILFAPISPLVMGFAFWGNGVSPFERKVAGKLASIALWKVVPLVSMFPQNTRATFAIIEWSRFEDRHQAIKKSMKLYATYRAHEKTNIGKKIGARAANSRLGQFAARAGRAVRDSSIGQTIANSPGAQRLMQGERKFGEDFTLKDVRPGVKSVLHPSDYSKDQREKMKDGDASDAPQVPGRDSQLGQYADAVGAARNILSPAPQVDGIRGIRKEDIQKLPPEVLNAALNEDAGRLKELERNINDAQALVEGPDVDGMLPDERKIPDDEARRVFFEEEERLSRYKKAVDEASKEMRDSEALARAQARENEILESDGISMNEKKNHLAELRRQESGGQPNQEEQRMRESARPPMNAAIDGIGGKPMNVGTTGDNDKLYAPLNLDTQDKRQVRKLVDDVGMDSPSDAGNKPAETKS